MSYTFTLSANEPQLCTQIYPPIRLEEDVEYTLGLINFESYNSIPNIDETNNTFHYGHNKKIVLPEGSYEIEAIYQYLLNAIKSAKETEKIDLHIAGNLNTLKCEIKCSEIVDFSKKNSVGSLLGFGKRKLEANKIHESDIPVDIFKVNAVAVECNLVTNSYNNGKPVHILHMFYPDVPPGYKIVERPTNVIYLPINTRYIDEIILKITDQDGRLINFRKELITIRLHLKRSS